MYVPTWLGIYAVLVLFAGLGMQLYSMTRGMPANEAEFQKIRRRINFLANLGVAMLFSVPVLVSILWIAGMLR
jgi:hypothetical protein